MRRQSDRPELDLYFSDTFGVPKKVLRTYGAFNVSLVTDLPLFVDPFLLFNSRKAAYRRLHEGMIQYLRFLKAKSEGGLVTPSLVGAWYHFREVKQNWLGFCEAGNRGRGLGRDFANALNANLAAVFRDFGEEQVTRGSHIEKLGLIRAGVGRDMVSDFTTNLILGYLLCFTQRFAQQHLDASQRAVVSVRHAQFDYEREYWVPGRYELPVYRGEYVILTPRDILTKDETWINHGDMIERFGDIPDALEDAHLRAQVNNYFHKLLSQTGRRKGREAKRAYEQAAQQTVLQFPALIDYYIRMKEQTGDQAVANSELKVSESQLLYIEQFGQLAGLLLEHTRFYALRANTKDETREKINFFRDVIENKGGYRLFYVNGEPVRREQDLQIAFRLVWHGTVSDVSREANDGRGPADLKVSRGARDKTLVEFKLASNSQLKLNLQHQVEIYQKASDAQTGFTVIVFFTEEEEARVYRVLQELVLLSHPSIFLIDARQDNKPSASRA